MNFSITVQHAEEHATRLSQLSVAMERIITRQTADELEAIGAMLEGQVKKRTPKDTGALRASVFSELRVSGQSLEELVSTPLIYGAPVEFGSKPHFPPPAALAGWAARKLGDAKAAFAVARKIAQRGTPEKRMFQDAWEENAGRVEQMLETIGVHVSEELLRNL